MENQEELNKAIGTIEPEKREALQPKKVKIVDVNFRDTKKGKIINCKCSHPDKEAVNISSVSYLKDKQIVTSGLWFTLDKESNIQKGCALATLMQNLVVNTPEELKGKEAETELDDDGWLCFKAY